MSKARVFRTVLLVASAMTSAAVAFPAAAQTASTPTAPVPTNSAPAPATTAAHPVAAMSDNLSPQWGNIRSFWGDNTPFWGNIRSFWGDSGPYADNLTAFWGNIRSFNDGTDANSILPQWGNIRSFAGDIGASWGNIRSFWGNIRSFSDAPGDYTQLATMVQGIVTQSQTTFGATYTAQTGLNFQTGFAQPLLAKYGIDLNNPQSLASLDANTREHFFIDWWDNLMNYSGADHVDHWMREVNWNPALTQQVGMSGGNSTVGILDFTITGEAANSVVKYGGVSTLANGHGAAVASLIVDPMDGKGVMGIAPSASVISYNPFDATQTAGWSDITNGVAMLTKNGATIINMSLGVPGWTLNGGWDTVFQDKSVNASAKKQVFVIAAGNDGTVQTQNVVWHPNNPNFIVVGSADPTGTISYFSNQPGNACLTDPNGKCNGDYLMNHFMVAPGELILVSDGQGGVTRYSGTSFAAPLVSGTIALIQDRWPWLTAHPSDVTGIVLNSARDLGAPGVDPVYGHGELDVGAALSPLDWSKLQVKQVINGQIINVPLPTTQSALQNASAATRASWEANSVYFTLFENTGESYRDFEVPMSSKLANKTVSVGGSSEQFMSYLVGRFTSWISAPSGPAAPAGPAGPAPKPLQFTDLRPSVAQFAGEGGMTLGVSMQPRATRMGFARTGAPIESAVHLADADERFGFDMGSGSSAGVIGNQAGFGMASDYDVENGGANPFVGFASGGSFAKASVRLAPGLRLSSAVTERSLKYDTTTMRLDQKAAWATDPYHATAATMSVDFDATQRLSTSLGYTMLHEDNTVLGMGSIDRSDLPNGSTTDAATMGVNYALTRTVSLAGSATVGRTRMGDVASGGLAVGSSGLVSSAFQVAATKQSLFTHSDRIRLTLAQPMHVEHGTLDYSTVSVIDRDTGELGVATQHGDVTGNQRRMVSEVLYGRSLMNGRSEVALFGRANFGGDPTQYAPLTAGGSFRLAL